MIIQRRNQRELTRKLRQDQNQKLTTYGYFDIIGVSSKCNFQKLPPNWNKTKQKPCEIKEPREITPNFDKEKRQVHECDPNE
jgi:hypothetical protein